MAMQNIYKNRMLRFYKLFDTIKLCKGSVSKSSYSIDEVRSTESLEFGNPSNGLIQTDNIQFTVPAGTSPNMLELSTLNPLQFGGTKATKIYMEEYADIMDNLDGTDKEYVVGKKKIGGSTYDFILYEENALDYDDLTIPEGNSVSGAFDSMTDVYSAFASANSQWVSGADSWFLKFEISSSGSMSGVTRGIARHSDYIGSKLLGNSLTFKMDSIYSNVVYDLEYFTQDEIAFPDTGVFGTKIIEGIEKGAI